MKAFKGTKNQGLITRTVAVALAITSAFLMGCGSDGGSGGGKRRGAVDPTSPYPPVTDPVVLPTNGGVTVDLINVTKGTLDEYTGVTSNVPTEPKLILNLKKIATYAKAGGGIDVSYGGTVAISFKDGSQTFQDTFSSLVNSSGVIHTNTENHKYNLLTTDYPELAGNIGYHGFFQDTYGAVILVIDSTNDQGDGQGPTSANGSIWFKNHELASGPLSPTSCWFVSAGPYDCRTWRRDGKVETKRSIYPDSYYKKLGSFINLDIKKAFNEQPI